MAEVPLDCLFPLVKLFLYSSCRYQIPRNCLLELFAYCLLRYYSLWTSISTFKAGPSSVYKNQSEVRKVEV